MGCGGSAVMDLEPIEERAEEFSTWVGKFDSEHRIPAAFSSAADVPALLAEVERLRAKVDRLMGLLEPYTREYPKECNKRVAAENERDAALAEAKHYRTQRDEWFLRESGEREAAEADVVFLRTRIRKARDQRDEARAEVARLREGAQVLRGWIAEHEETIMETSDALDEARLAARPAPAWDEEAVAEAVRKDLEAAGILPWTNGGARIVRTVLAVVREHLPVKPSREEVARALALVGDYDGCFERLDAWAAASSEARECGDVEEPMSTDGEDAEWWLKRADAVLSLLPGRSEAEVKAEALREAGQDLPGEWSKQDRRKVERWLRSRPYRLAADGGADRG